MASPCRSLRFTPSGNPRSEHDEHNKGHSYYDEGDDDEVGGFNAHGGLARVYGFAYTRDGDLICQDVSSAYAKKVIRVFLPRTAARFISEIALGCWIAR